MDEEYTRVANVQDRVEVKSMIDLVLLKKDIFQEDGRGWRLPGFLYADNLVLHGESEEDLRAMVGHFFEVCKRAW